MPGTRTAPDVSVVDQTQTLVTLHLIDASGDLYAQTFTVLGVAADADVQDVAAEYQAVTNASLWKITVSAEYIGDADPNNAVAAYRASVKDGINLLYKDAAAGLAQTPRVIAPVDTVMQGNQDIPLLSGMTTLITEIGALIGAGYSLLSAQFTERRERSNNPRIRA